MADGIDVTDLKDANPETLRTALSLLKDTRDESQEIVGETEEMLADMEERRKRLKRLQRRAGPEQYDEVAEMLSDHEDELAQTESLKEKAEAKRDFAERRIGELQALLDC